MNSTGSLVFVRSALIACTWGLASLLSGCGGSSDGAGEPTTSVSAPVGATGGALELQGLAITLPANAIPETVNLSITSLTAGADEIARFQLSPAGQALSVPTELRFARAGLPAKTSFFWDVNGELRLVPSLLVGDVLTAQISSLGLNAAGNVLLAQAAASNREKSLAVRALADSPAEGGTVVVMPMDCAARIPEMAARLKRVAASDDSEAVIRAFDEIVAAKQLCLEAEVQALKDRSCEALDVAQLKAQLLVADSFKSFQELTLPLIAAEAFVQETGASCPSADSARVGPLIADKFDQFLRILQAQQLRGVFAEKATVSDIQVLLSYQISCARLGLDAICERLDNEIFPNLFDGMRRGAFDECRSSGSPLVVSQLHFLGTSVTDTSTFLGFGRFGMADLEADMSYCTNPSLELRVFAKAAVVPEELTDRASTLRPLVGLGNYVRSTTVAVPRDGKLTVSGELAALRCADDTVSPADLVVRIGSQEVARRSLSGNVYPLSTAPLDLVVSRMLASAGLDVDTTTSFTVSINREGGQCLGALGPTLDDDFTLFEIRVNLAPGSVVKRSISGGPLTSCAITAAGGVQCWGEVNGDRGNPQRVPVDAPGLASRAVSVASGARHTCVLTDSGNVKCWGGNSDGALGDGTTVSSATPVDVVGLGAGVLALSVQGEHGCALTAVGGVRCWGLNARGMLGDGTLVSRSSPVDVAGLGSGVTDVSVGDFFTCALTIAGGVKCWGANSAGQLGNGTTQDSFVPVDVTGLGSGVVSISAGTLQACALTNAGAVKCWGNRGTSSSTVPVQVTGFGNPVASIAVGFFSACAVTTLGGVQCWGAQLGSPFTSSATPLDVVGLGANVVEVSLGGFHACARMRDSSLRCWGENSTGQLGNNSTVSSSVPVSVVGFP